MGSRYCISYQLLGGVSGPRTPFPSSRREVGKQTGQPCVRFCSSYPWCGGNPREGFKISLKQGGLRVRKLPWMTGNKRIEIKRDHTAQFGGRRQVWRQGRCAEVNALSVNFQWFERVSLGNCECFPGRGKGGQGSDYQVPSTTLERFGLILKAMAAPLRILIRGDT